MKALFAILFLCIFSIVRAQDSSTINAASMRLLQPVLWQQTAAEYRALCYQAYNLAALRLQQLPRKTKRKKNLAIITDIDETLFDNSPFEAQLVKDNVPYSEACWKQWVDKSEAAAVPGAVDFFIKAKQEGIHIFYISNRDSASIGATLINLQQAQFPDADSAHLLFKMSTSSKENRRQQVMMKYNVVMLLGDNLADFSFVFEHKTIGGRFAETDKVKEEWGKKFIVLPNPMYGDWESAWYNYRYDIKEGQKQTILLGLLKGFLL